MSTFAEDAGISLDDDPTSLFQLLVLCMLQAKPIRATAAAVDAARGLFDAGLTSPSALVEAPRSQLIRIFGAAGYACATMFAREAQGVWPELAPVFDKKALQGAAKLGLPEDAQELESHARSEGVALPAFAAHLVKVALGVE